MPVVDCTGCTDTGSGSGWYSGMAWVGWTAPERAEASSESSSLTRWRRSAFSSMSRASSVSTRSRKASTSSSL